MSEIEKGGTKKKFISTLSTFLQISIIFAKKFKKGLTFAVLKLMTKYTPENWIIFLKNDGGFHSAKEGVEGNLQACRLSEHAWSC